MKGSVGLSGFNSTTFYYQESQQHNFNSQYRWTVTRFIMAYLLGYFHLKLFFLKLHTNINIYTHIF